MTGFRNRHFFVVDLLLIPFSLYVSFVLRVEQINLGSYWPTYLLLTGIALVVVPLVLYAFGLYSRYWRGATPLSKSYFCCWAR